MKGTHDPVVNKQRSEALQKLWADPEYRRKMLEKQKRAGYRAYGTRLTNYRYEK